MVACNDGRAVPHNRPGVIRVGACEYRGALAIQIETRTIGVLGHHPRDGKYRVGLWDDEVKLVVPVSIQGQVTRNKARGTRAYKAHKLVPVVLVIVYDANVGRNLLSIHEVKGGTVLIQEELTGEAGDVPPQLQFPGSHGDPVRAREHSQQADRPPRAVRVNTAVLRNVNVTRERNPIAAARLPHGTPSQDNVIIEGSIVPNVENAPGVDRNVGAG